MVRLKNVDWKLYFSLLLIFGVIIVLSVVFLPSEYRYLAFIWVFFFWGVYHYLSYRKKKREEGS